LNSSSYRRRTRRRFAVSAAIVDIVSAFRIVSTKPDQVQESTLAQVCLGV
jgi:hypothetical protein